MMYLLKITIAWSLFLILFETLYQNNGKFALNRMYLLLSISAGLLLPLIELPQNTPALFSATPGLYGASHHTIPLATAPVTRTAHPAIGTMGIDPWLVLGLLYGLGCSLLAFKSMMELGKMLRLILRGERRMIGGRKVIVTHGNHAPYSFMGWIFLPDPDACDTQELQCILRHEWAHNRNMHWLDLLALQVICIIFWFHPLVWRFRYLLQLQHEYEADRIAAENDAYGYGHFLLQQTLLNGVPSIAHSFHFSPMKNRITMLTKRQNGKTGAWKYALLLPALLGCTWLMAKDGARLEKGPGQVTTYKGNTIRWRETDTLYYDRQRKVVVPVAAGAKNRIVFELNGEPVYQNEFVDIPAAPGYSDGYYTDYLRDATRNLFRNTIDSLTTIDVLHAVVDKDGKVIFCDIRYSRPYYHYLHFKYQAKEWAPDQHLNSIMDRIITESPRWKPAMLHGKPVNSVVSFRAAGC